MGGILGLAVKKGSGIFKGEGHWRCSVSASWRKKFSFTL